MLKWMVFHLNKYRCILWNYPFLLDNAPMWSKELCVPEIKLFMIKSVL